MIYTKNTTFAYTKVYTIVYTKHATDKGSVYNNPIARDYHGNTIGKAGTGSDGASEASKKQGYCHYKGCRPKKCA